MARELTSRERRTLERLSFHHPYFVSRGQLPTGLGTGTLAGLVRRGLAEKFPAANRGGQDHWRITPNGWLCMYGMTYEEIMSRPPGSPKLLPIRGPWRWPLP